MGDRVGRTRVEFVAGTDSRENLGEKVSENEIGAREKEREKEVGRCVERKMNCNKHREKYKRVLSEFEVWAKETVAIILGIENCILDKGAWL